MSENLDYWRRQSIKNLFNDVDLLPPEQKRMAGKLLVIGGNRMAFFAVASALETAKRMGVGEVRALLPADLKGQVPSTSEVFFAPSGNSGAFCSDSLPEMLRLADWAEAVILIGDSGRNAETSLVLAEFLSKVEKPVLITRDAVDAVCPSVGDWLLRETETDLFVTMPQLQKLLRTLYYPKVITLSMPTNQLVETLHKFTLSYSTSIATFHNGLIVMAEKGEVVTQALDETSYSPISLWGGSLATKVMVARLWNSEKEFNHVFASVAAPGHEKDGR